MFTPEFWKETAERAVKTTAQVAIAMIGTNAIGLMDVDWQAVASGSALGAILSVLTSIASEPIGDGDTPSLVVEKPKRKAIK